MSNVNNNTKNFVKKGEEIFKINEKKTFYIPNRVTNHKINLIETKIKKIIKCNKEGINNRNNINKLDDEELDKNFQKRTFIATNRTNNKSIFSNYMNKIIPNQRSKYFQSFINPNAITINNDIFNKRKLLINKRKKYNNNNFLTIPSFKNTIKKNSTTILTKRIKNSEISINNQLKKGKDVIESYNNNKKINQNNNFSNINFGISKIMPKKKNSRVNLLYTKANKLNDKFTILKVERKKEKKKEEKKEKKEEMKDNVYILDIESEHINPINKLKIENYDINKPHEYKMKFSLLNEYNDEKNNPNDDENKAEKVIIGKIEGYKDIIESDKIYLKNNINNQNKNKLLKQIEKNEKVKNNLRNLEGFSIFEENSSEFYDQILLNYNYCKTNKNLENIENEYEFEDLSTHEYENKINKNKMILFNNEKAK